MAIPNQNSNTVSPSGNTHDDGYHDALVGRPEDADARHAMHRLRVCSIQLAPCYVEDRLVISQFLEGPAELGCPPNGTACRSREPAHTSSDSLARWRDSDTG